MSCLWIHDERKSGNVTEARAREASPRLVWDRMFSRLFSPVLWMKTEQRFPVCAAVSSTSERLLKVKCPSQPCINGTSPPYWSPVSDMTGQAVAPWQHSNMIVLVLMPVWAADSVNAVMDPADRIFKTPSSEFNLWGKTCSVSHLACSYCGSSIRAATCRCFHYGLTMINHD